MTVDLSRRGSLGGECLGGHGGGEHQVKLLEELPHDLVQLGFHLLGLYMIFN